MDKKYQVFISSTFSDLIDERQAISRAVLDMGHIPAGMEMFPASDSEQLTYIKKIIDECDYYVIVIGGRYGSIDESGVSYTEREYDYAVSSDKPVLAFIHSNLDEIPLGKTDKDAAKLEKLASFREKVSTGRLVQFWDNGPGLKASAIISLQKAFSDNPQVGWVRADAVANTELMAEVIKHRTENDALRARISRLEESVTPKFEDVADLSAITTIEYNYFTEYGQRSGSKDLSFFDVLIYTAPSLHNPCTIENVKAILTDVFIKKLDAPTRSLNLHVMDVRNAIMHLVATGHVKMYNSKTIDGKQHVTAYQLTPLGVQTWQEASYKKKS